MPDMKIHPSGAILFHLTPQERQLEDMKKALQKELDEVQALKEELRNLIEQYKQEE